MGSTDDLLPKETAIDLKSVRGLVRERNQLAAEVERLRGELRRVQLIGHNDDCLFCGFKDRAVYEALNRDALKPTAMPDKSNA